MKQLSRYKRMSETYVMRLKGELINKLGGLQSEFDYEKWNCNKNDLRE